MTDTKGRKRSVQTPNRAFGQIYARQLGAIGASLRRMLVIWINQATTEADIAVLLEQARLIPGYREHFRAEFLRRISGGS